uniref:Uncharacterized protein n=1 Tax=Anopheles minimus TaxID=112268 RepID=A0A182WPE6_9DIPT
FVLFYRFSSTACGSLIVGFTGYELVTSIGFLRQHAALLSLVSRNEGLLISI